MATRDSGEEFCYHCGKEFTEDGYFNHLSKLFARLRDQAGYKGKSDSLAMLYKDFINRARQRRLQRVTSS